MTSNSNVLALDVGSKRIGVAIARNGLRVAQPLKTLDYSDAVFEDIATLVQDEAIGELVLGFPRNLSGEETAQTQFVRDFAQKLSKVTTVKIHFQDEALTSVAAEQQLNETKKPYQKGDVDAVAASMILSDFLEGSA